MNSVLSSDLHARGNHNMHVHIPIIHFVVYPVIIKDTFIRYIVVLAPESFNLSVEFVAICMEFNVTWKLNGSLVNNDSDHTIVNSHLGNGRYITSIRISQSSYRDAGIYAVTVTSATGNDNVNITVKISSKCYI